MLFLINYNISIILTIFLIIFSANKSFADINRAGVICSAEDGYDYGYSFNNGSVMEYKFVVTENKVLSNLKILGEYVDQSAFIEWQIQFSGRVFWFRLNKSTNVLTTESKDVDLVFNHQCEAFELMEWNRKLSELGDFYQFEYDKYLKFSDEYQKEITIK